MATYKPLQSIALTVDTSSVTFSGIDQNYTDLVLVCSSTDSVTIYARLGDVSVDSGANYSYTYLLGYASTAATGRNSNVTKGYLSLSSDVSAKEYHTITNFQDYSNTTRYKTFLTRYSDSTIYSAAVVNLWRSKSAIKIITVYGDGGNIPSGSTFSLYGIKSGAPQALGGDVVTTDGNYWYHTFRSTQTFTTQRPLTVDYLVVAGGGGGGFGHGGGGGGGGLRSTLTRTGGNALGVNLESALSLPTSTYTVTVGAGGAAGVTSSLRASNGSDSVFSTITSTGGGGGGSRLTETTGAVGGSGGGGSLGGTGGAGTNNQGFAGGGSASTNPGSGGGGAGAVGSTAITIAGVGANGGAGVSSSLSGSSVGYAGGGGGGSNGGGGTSTNGSATDGGGGGGGTVGTAGTANLGGGGGGGAFANNAQQTGAAGGSGIVIVRYPV
jgi:hypothetical protein